MAARGTGAARRPGQQQGPPGACCRCAVAGSFHGMALDERSLVECAVITDGHECFFYYAGAGVLEPLADFDAQHSPEHRLKRCSSEGRTGQQFPEPLVLPEIVVVDGTL